ncbi:hypothetical protein HDV06_001632 [Boothiomyces sp. JEL0866]|nr:hypothetical protein HDV06_001632 [Boothiomyces sp. JEL0866]
MSETYILQIDKPLETTKEEPDDLRSFLYTAFVEIPYMLIWGDDSNEELDLEDLEHARQMLMYGVSQYSL